MFRDADLIVASPPCQFFSYCAMPWTRAKALAAEVRADPARLEKELELFNACFRIQREACAAAERHIPLIVENVKGAQSWVGEAQGNFGSFYLWGDVPVPQPGLPGFDVARQPLMNSAIKNNGGSWFNVAHNTMSGKGANPDGRKIGGFRFNGSGGSFQSAAVARVGGRIADGGWFEGNASEMHEGHSKSSRRKAASALIAKIPEPLARYIGQIFLPR